MGAAIGLGFGIGLLLMSRAIAHPLAGRSRRRGLRDRIDLELRAAGIASVSATGLLWLIVLGGLVGGVVVLTVSKTPPVAIAFALLTAYSPLAVVRGRARRRTRELAEVWPEVVDNLASAIRAGLSLPEALTQLGERGPSSLRASFASFGRDYLATGRFTDCLDRLKADLADPVGDRVVEALRIAREVGGGDLGRMLRSLSRFLRDDARTRAELEARQAWVVNGAKIAAAAPWAVLLALSFQPDVVGRYRSPAGVAVLAVGATVCFVAYRLMVRLGRLPSEQRVLA